MSLLNELASNGSSGAAARVLGHQRQSRFGEDTRPDYLGTYSYFPSIKKPVIAAMNGHAVGLGFILTLYCDLRFASDQAKFGTAFSRRGLIAEYGIAWILPRLIGPANALDLLLSARIIDAAEASRMGLGESRVSSGDIHAERPRIRDGVGEIGIAKIDGGDQTAGLSRAARIAGRGCGERGKRDPGELAGLRISKKAWRISLRSGRRDLPADNPRYGQCVAKPDTRARNA